MHSSLKRAMTVAAGLALVSVSTFSAWGAGAASHPVRVGDLTASAQQDGGTYEFLKEGLHLKTTNADGYAKGYFPVGLSLDGLSTVSYDWYGTANKPGVYYNIDLDGDGKYDGQLIGELAYGGKDVWLNRDAEDPDLGSGANKGLTVPSGTFAKLAPSCDGSVTESSSDSDIEAHCTGGSGSPFHGDLAAWATKLKQSNPKARLLTGGFLANGLVMDGVLRSISYGGSDDYVFTDDAEAPSSSQVDVTAGFTTKTNGHYSSVSMQSDPLPGNSTEGKKVSWKVLVDGGQKFADTMGAGETASYIYYNPGSAKKTIQVYKNGALVKSFKN